MLGKLFVKWHPYVKNGRWPDGDMLPLGKIGIRAERGDPRMSLFTRDEQHTLMTLWSIARSPLMFGGNLPDNDDFTLSLLTNGEVLEVNQKATASRQLFSRGHQVAWTAEIAGSEAKYLAVFNIGDHDTEDIRVNWSQLGLPENCLLRDLWARKDIGTVKDGQVFHLAPHAAAIYELTPADSASSGNTPYASAPPFLRKQGTATQLIVDGKPFLAVAGELGNNTASSLENIKPIWPKLASSNLNCVLAAVSWAQMKPEEGKFEFDLLDGLIQEARLGLLGLGVGKTEHNNRGPATTSPIEGKKGSCEE